MAKKVKKVETTSENQEPENTPELQPLADDVREVFHQDIPLRSEFKQELNTRLRSEVEQKTGKSLSPERHRRAGRIARGMKDFFRFPWPRWAYAASALGVVVVLVGSAAVLHGWKWDQNSIIQSIVNTFQKKPVYADADIILEKQGDTAEGVGLDGSFSIVCKEALDTASVEKSLAIEPALPGSFSWSEGNTRADFVPSVPLHPGEVYKVTIEEGARTADGKEYGRALKWAFQTIPTFAITGVTPMDLSTSAPKETTIEVEFNYRDLDAQAFAGLFSIDPEVSGSFETMDNKVVFLPEQPFTPETIYRVAVRAGFGNGQGQAISEDKAWEFQVQSNRYVSGNTDPWYDFGLTTAGVYTWVAHPDDTAAAAQTMDVSYANVSEETTFHFAVYRTDMESVLLSQVWAEDSIRRPISPADDRLILESEWDQSVSAQARTSNSSGHYYPQQNSLQLDLPELSEGVYYIRMTSPLSDIPRFVYLLISDTAISYQKDQNGSLVIWLADSPSRKASGGQEIGIYQLKNGLSELSKNTAGEDGILKTEAPGDLGAIVSGNAAIFFSDYYSWRYGYGMYGWYGDWQRQNKDYNVVFALDRPLYKPGDEVFYKAVIRNDNDGVYSVPPRGTVVTVSSYNGAGNYTETKTIDNDYGSVSGSFVLSEEIGYGSLRVAVQKDGTDISIGSQDFEIAYYRKPDYELKLTVDAEEVVAGTPVEATASLQYFFGQPIANRDFTYRVFSNEFFEQDPAETPWPWANNMYYYGGTNVISGQGTSDENGEFRFEIPTELSNTPLSSPMNNYEHGTEEFSRRYTVEVSYTDDLQVQNVEYQNVMVHHADTFLYRDTEKYGHRVGDEVGLDLRLYDSLTQVPAASSADFSLSIYRTWYEVTGQVEHSSYDPATKTQIFWTENVYTRHNDTIQSSVSVGTDGNGRGRYAFTPILPGQYSFVLTGQDDAGRTIPALPRSWNSSGQNEWSVWVSDGDDAGWWDYSSSGLRVTADQETYQIGDTAKVTITSPRPDGSALVTVTKGSFVSEQVVDLVDGTAEIEVPVTEDMIPNFLVHAVTPSNGSFSSSDLSVLVDTSYKKLEVDVAVEDKTYLPGDEVTVSLNVRDSAGQGTASEAVVYLIDKALLQVQEENASTWYDTLYRVRNYFVESRSSAEDKYGLASGAEGGGCFRAGTEVSTPTGLQAIETLGSGDEVISYDPATGAAVTNQVVKLLVHPDYVLDPLVEITFSDGSTLEVTTNHMVWSESARAWKPAGELAAGDRMLRVNNGAAQTVDIISIDQLGRGETVYNLELSGQPHTYLVGSGILVHNEKGEASVRQVFKDSAAFEAHVFTDADGTGQVTVTLPDNLTTWVVRVKAVTQDTEVGDGTAELVVQKKVIVRPSIPNFLIAGDTLDFTSIVHNYTGADQRFNVSLEGEGFAVEGDAVQTVDIPDGGQLTVTFRLKVQDIREAVFHLKAITEDGSAVDEVISRTPVENTTVETRAPLGYSLTNGEEATFLRTGSDVRDQLALSVEPTLATSLRYAYADVYGSRYNSTPELTEQLFTNLMFYENYDALTPYQSREDIYDAIESEVTSLTGLYHYGQGWGYFDYDAVDAGLNAQACLALGLAGGMDGDLTERAGTLEDCTNVISGKLEDETVSLDDKAFMLYALAVGGKGDLIATQALSESAADIQSGSVSYLALALRELGDEERGRALLTGIPVRAQSEDQLSYFADSSQSYQHPQTRVSQTSLVLHAYSIFDMEPELSERMARWLDQSRRSFSWYQVFDQSQSLRGLLSYALVHDDLSASYEVTVRLNGFDILAGKVEKGRWVEGQSQATIKADQLTAGENTLSVVSSGSGPVYLTGSLTTWTSTIPESSRISLARSFLTLDGQEQTTFRRGDLVAMEFRYDGTALDESEYSRASYELQGYLPAGFELIDNSFGTTTQGDRQARAQVYAGVPDERRIWGWTQNGLDRVEANFGHSIPHYCSSYSPYYSSYSSNTSSSANSYDTEGNPEYCYPQVLRVLVRASFTGEFSTRPAALFSEDIPSAYAYSEVQTVAVEP